ncbi:MAG: C39 family peptidase [Clostridia bacterium]|nr:C39 family peptidase [Clostridia bacterium]
MQARQQAYGNNQLNMQTAGRRDAAARRKQERIKKQRKRRRRFLMLLICVFVMLIYINRENIAVESFIPLDTGNVVYYSQRDSRWGEELYGRSGTIAEAGCGPTCLAMAASTLTGQSITPLDAAKWAVDNGQRCEGSGSFHSIIPAGGKHYGFSVEGVGRDREKILSALKNNEPVVVLMSRGHFTSSGHFILLRGLSPSGKVLVSDPMSKMRSIKTWELELIINESKAGATDGGPFWICRGE